MAAGATTARFISAPAGLGAVAVTSDFIAGAFAGFVTAFPRLHCELLSIASASMRCKMHACFVAASGLGQQEY
jgi:hypothetical protein